MSEDLIRRIASRCYWKTSIRPERFEANRISDYSQLLPIVRDSSVSLRGWDFPQVSSRASTRKAGQDWAGEALEWNEYLELWRLYQSGQFVHVRGLTYDWAGVTEGNRDGNGAVGFLPLWDTIYRFTEIYEFAARLAVTDAGDNLMRVHVQIGNLEGRVLVQDNPARGRLFHYQYHADRFVHPHPDEPPLSIEALVANPRELAATALLDLFHRFEFEATVESIRSWQQELAR